MLLICLFKYLISQKQISAEEIALMSYVIFFTLALSVVFVTFFIAFQKRKNRLLLDKIEQQKAFDEELVKSQQEIQEETFKHVGRELHDNVGQMLSYASMQLNSVVRHVSDDLRPKADEASKALKDSLAEVRALSKSLNTDVIFNLGFETSLSNEINRLNRLGELNASLDIKGKKVPFENKKDEIILFRILQEFYSNTLKYAESDKLQTSIAYNADGMSIIVKDNGKGFNIAEVQKGSGLINMEKRAEMINVEFDITSEENKGTALKLRYSYTV